jgi:hypothetical protein
MDLDQPENTVLTNVPAKLALQQGSALRDLPNLPRSPPNSPKGFLFSLFNSINNYEKEKEEKEREQKLREPIFKDIPGFEGRYHATVSGGIYSVKSRKFLKPGDDTYSYNTVCIDRKTYKVHKLIAMTFLDNPNKYTQIDHINQNRKDNRIENLRYVSNSENQLNKKTRVPKPKDMKNILVKNTTFKVSIKRKDQPSIHKSFKTIEEAKAFRDATLEEKKLPTLAVAP